MTKQSNIRGITKKYSMWNMVVICVVFVGTGSNDFDAKLFCMASHMFEKTQILHFVHEKKTYVSKTYVLCFTYVFSHMPYVFHQICHMFEPNICFNHVQITQTYGHYGHTFSIFLAIQPKKRPHFGHTFKTVASKSLLT